MSHEFSAYNYVENKITFCNAHLFFTDYLKISFFKRYNSVCRLCCEWFVNVKEKILHI